MHIAGICVSSYYVEDYFEKGPSQDLNSGNFFVVATLLESGGGQSSVNNIENCVFGAIISKE